MGLLKQKKQKVIPYNADTFNSLFGHIKIQTNNLCTRKCLYCYFGNEKKINISEKLPDHIVYKIIDELSDLKYTGRLSFFEINEPLTDTRICEFIGYAKIKVPNAWQVLITNGDLLDINILKELLNSGLDKLYISIYDIKLKKRLMALKKEYPPLFKKICFMNLIKELFVDNRGGNIKKYKEADVLKKPYKLPCEKVYKILNIRPSGKVVSCSADFYEVNVLGNVFHQSIKEIWLGKDFKKFRKSLDNGNRNFSRLCKKCNYLGSGGYFTR